MGVGWGKGYQVWIIVASMTIWWNTCSKSFYSCVECADFRDELTIY